MAVKVEVLGVAAIRTKLRSLPERMQRNVLAAGNRAVANETAKEARIGGTSTTRAAVSARPNPRKRKTKAFMVGLRRPFGRMAHWFEFGTGARVQRTTGRETGRMPATPFLRPAIERMRAKAEQVWSRAASRNLALQLRKMGGR